MGVLILVLLALWVLFALRCAKRQRAGCGCGCAGCTQENGSCKK